MRDPLTHAYIPSGWETVPCPICNESRYTLYERFGNKLQYTYVKCDNCGLIYSSPRPIYDQDFIDSCYASYYQYAENLELSDLNQVRESSLQMFKKEVAYLAQYDSQKTAVLDIGSGMGTFLYAAKPFYPKLLGLDVSYKMAAFVEKIVGIEVIVAPFENFEYPTPFSLIHMSHVIEHIPDPNLWLQHAKKLLSPKGILVINVPNKLGLSRRVQHFFYKMGLKKGSADWTDAGRTPDHLYEPTIKSFKLLLHRNGFEIIEHYTYSRRDPASNSNALSKLMHRYLKIGSNITFIARMEGH